MDQLHLPRSSGRFGASSRRKSDSSRHQGPKCLADIGRECQTRRFRRLGATGQNNRQKKHFYRNAVLDGARSYRLRPGPAQDLRQQIRYLVARNHRHRNGGRSAATMRAASDARAFRHSASSSSETEAARQMVFCLSELRHSVAAERLPQTASR